MKKVQTQLWLDGDVKAALDTWALEYGPRAKSFRVNRLLRHFLEKKGYLAPKVVASPQAGAMGGDAPKKAGIFALAVFGALTLLGTPAQADSKVSTFVGPGVHILSTWKIRRSRLHVLKRVSGL